MLLAPSGHSFEVAFDFAPQDSSMLSVLHVQRTGNDGSRQFTSLAYMQCLAVPMALSNTVDADSLHLLNVGGED